jgi:hypothetical protein
MSIDNEMNELEAQAHASGGLLGGWFFPLSIDPPRGPVLDDRGRAWHVPRDKASLMNLLYEYSRRHGPPVSAVDEVFLRHGKLNDLRVLILRGIEGETINIAARALQLGPMTPYRRKVPHKPGYPADAQQRMWAFDDRRDAETMAAVQREAARLSALGYTD